MADTDSTPVYQDEFVKTCNRLLVDPVVWHEWSEKRRERARCFTIESMLDQWLALAPA